MMEIVDPETAPGTLRRVTAATAATTFRAPAPFRSYRMLIGGESVAARSGATIETSIRTRSAD
jgi:hypothetical protein